MSDTVSGGDQAGPEPVRQGGRHPARPSIAERAARRDALVGGRDRYSSLVRALQAGRELPIQGGRGRFVRYDWNPIARKLIAVIVVGVLLYFVARTGADWLRQESVTTWTGPDATVRSGQKLASCPAAAQVPVIDLYPNWVQWQGRILVRTENIRPGVIDGVRYIDTGYHAGELVLVQLLNSDAGRAGTEVMIWSGSLGGFVYRTLPDCDPA